jgi:hypothetical protein
MTKTIVFTSIVLLFLAIGFGILTTLVSFSNTEISLRNKFEQEIDTRTALYDNMWKTLSQKSEVAVKNDESFYRNVNAIMEGRKDAGDMFMKWVQESNPNVNYEAVSVLYQDLSRAIEGKRDAFEMQERIIQSVVLQHKNHLQKFPNSLWNVFFNRHPLEYKPITSDRTDMVMKTGKDNDVKLF